MYEELLREHIEDKTSYGERPQAPCDDTSLATLRDRARRELGLELPDAYVSFLRVTNGLDSNGLTVYAAETSSIVGHEDMSIEGIVDANLGWWDFAPHRAFLYFAESGISLYAVEIRTGRFLVIDRQSHSDMEEVASFEALMARALEASHP